MYGFFERWGVDPGSVIEGGNDSLRCAWNTPDSAYFSCWPDLPEHNAEFRRFFESLEPSRAVQRLLDPFRTWFADKTVVGIHFRGTDRIGPEGRRRTFESLLARIGAYGPNTRFCVASDSAAARTELVRALPGRVEFQRFRVAVSDRNEIWEGRASVIGMQEATADMFAIAKCRDIICNVESTFSECASYIGNSELVVA